MRPSHTLALLFLGASGCAYAVPFIVPPTHLHVATGAAEGVITAPGPALGSGPSTGAVQRSGDLYLELRGSVSPQSAMISRRHRDFEINPGYGALFFLPRLRQPYIHHGPYLELGISPNQVWTDPNTALRVYLSLAPQLVFADTGPSTEVGAAVRLGITAEVVSFAQSAVGHRSRRGVSWWGTWGEYALSLELSTGAEYIAQNAFWTIALGVSIRLPSFSAVAAGVAYPGDE